MNIVVAAFYADIPGKPSRFDEFLPLCKASRRALAITNPSARYLILTDTLTAPMFRARDFQCFVCGADHMPLMSKIIFAQRAFLRSVADADLVVLPDVDCLANRSLDDAIPEDVGLAITHKGSKFRYGINNLAYVRDLKLGSNFLNFAYEILESWPLGRREWGGDQDAWQAALGDPDLWTPADGAEHFVATTPVGNVDVYPCATHNKPLSDDGSLRPKRHKDAYFVHLKGPRKQHLDSFVTQRFGHPC